MCVYLFLASSSFMAVFFLLINGSLFSRDQLYCVTPSINWIEDTFYLKVCNALKSDLIQTLESVTNKFRFVSRYRDPQSTIHNNNNYFNL